MNTFSIDSPFTAAGTLVTPIRVMHGQLPIAGFRIGDLAYMTDLSALPDSEWPKLRGVRTLVVSALRHEPHHTHQTIEQAVEMARRVNAEHTYFIHMCHQAGASARPTANSPRACGSPTMAWTSSAEVARPDPPPKKIDPRFSGKTPAASPKTAGVF